MALNYITVDENDFSFGIDARSGENQIQPGFVQDLLNGDIIERRARQRTGYQGFSGNLPVRVTSFEYTSSNNRLCMNLDNSIDLGSYRSTPIVVAGKSSNVASGGPFTTASTTSKYYPYFLVPTRKTMVETASAPPYETISILQEEHTLETSDMFVAVGEATNSIDRSYQTALPHDIIIDLASNDLSIEYQNSTGADKEVFVYYKDKQAATGSVYVHTYTKLINGPETFVIDAATHSLNNSNLVIQVQEDRTTEVAFIRPESVVIATNGDVSVTIDAPLGTTYYTILSTTVVSNQVTGNIAGTSTGTIELIDLTSPWIFYGIYLEEIAGGDRELVYADSIVYDDATGTATLSFQNNTSSAKKFICYYEYGTTRSNQLCVEDVSIVTDAVDTRPQLTIWGLDHAILYGDNAETRAGWVNHIDSYKSTQEQRLVAGLGGNLFDSRTYSEAAVSYLYARLYPNLRARTSDARILGPLFWDTGDTPARARGYITSDSSGTNWATVTSVEYDTGNDWTKYTLSLPSKAILDSTGTPTTLSSVISTTANLEDWLTVQNMSYARHNGTFKIMQVADGTDEIFIWVENSKNSIDYDDLNTGGEAGVFTDQLEWLTDSPFLSGDTLQNAAITDAFVSSVVSSSGAISVIDGLISLLDSAPGLVTVGTRTGSVLPIRTAQPTATSSVVNLVVGDMLSYSPVERLLRIIYINSDSDRTVDITADGSLATVTLLSGDTSYLSVGYKVVLLDAGIYSGEVTINSILSPTSFTFITTETDSASGATLLGNTIQIDESLEWADSTDDSILLQTDRRWIPIEAPEDSYDLTPSTYIRHFDSGEYDFQSFLRSTMVQNNMYLTNGQDEVFKYDGSNIYRAGLFPWQPGLFITQSTTATAKIVADNPSSIGVNEPTAVTDNVFTVPLGEEQKYPVGYRIRHSYAGGYNDYTILSTYNDGTNGFIKVQRISTTAITLGTNPAITLLSARRYYFRLNAVDANDNIIASAITGYQDHIIELATDAAVNIKLVGLPAWDIYDYDRLEVEIYATKLNSAAPFYKLTTQQMSFNNTEGYIVYTDSFADTDLIDLDIVSTALLGQELGVNWQQPLKGKYVTSAGNSLVLGNVRDYPQLDIQLVASGAVTNSTYAGKIFTFRKSSIDTGVDTNMPDRARYEFITGFTGNVGTITPGSDDFTVMLSGSTAGIVAGDWIYLTYSATGSANTQTFVDGDVNTGTDTITIASHGFNDGDQVRLSTVGGTLPTGLAEGITYYIVNSAVNTFQLSLSLGGSPVDITAAAGGGTHTIQVQGISLNYSGWWQIASVGATDVTINLNGAAAATSYPDRYVLATDPTDIPILLGTDRNLGMVNGDSFDLFDTMRRMSMAVNASMRMVDTTISGMESFQPWMTARGGNDVGKAGRLIIRQPRSSTDTLELLLPSSFSGGGFSFDTFVNEIRRSPAEEVSASARIYPSRILVSYDNFPEMFDNPTAILDTESSSAIDINSSDGQEITGVIPFFGESAYGAAQQSAVLVVFKQNSIYLVDINEKRAGNNAVQRLETEGLGCTAPYSIAASKNGIIFANESGIYCLRRNQAIEYIGQYMERNWTERVDLDQLSIAQGHHYGIGRSYKLSVPLVGNTENSEVYVYNHTGEKDKGLGSWVRYDNHPATGWANLASDAFFSSTSGRVFSLRRTGTESDFRDDSEAISFRLDTRPMDFGNSNIRKVLDKVVAKYRTLVRNTSSLLSISLDTSNNYIETTQIIIPKIKETSGLDDSSNQAIYPVAHSPKERRAIYFSVRIENGAIDQNIEVAGIGCRVGGLETAGILEAEATRSK